MKNRLLKVLAVTGAMALMLTACGQPQAQTAEEITPEGELKPNIEFINDSSEGGETQNNDTVTDAPEQTGDQEITPEADIPETSDSGTEAGADAGTIIDLKRIYSDIASSVNLVSPMNPTEEFIFNYYGIDTTALEDYVFVMSEEATSAETIVMIESSDSDIRRGAKESLETLREDKLLELQDYLPDQYTITERASVVEKGNVVYLVISENDEAILSVIGENL
ncbi:MAG: DUF4358 domain-containing protein [Lachnospiraceae bacterium]|nr:DUF4358 domain-containing protein [Candidatus Merdinaster equi]